MAAPVTALAKSANAPEVRAAAQEIETLSRAYAEEAVSLGHVENSVSLAICLVGIRDKMLLILPLLRALYNTQLGFRCDRPNDRIATPYDDGTLVDCACEAVLRGVQLTGNMFNIIAGRCYLTREGYQYKLARLPGLTEFITSFGVPRVGAGVGAGGAIVQCKATWTYNGKPGKVDQEFAVKLNSGMGADAAVGKAKRKLYAHCFDLMTGFTLPDSDYDAPEAGDTPTAALGGTRTDALAGWLGVASQPAAQPAAQGASTQGANRAVDLAGDAIPFGDDATQTVAQIDGDAEIDETAQNRAPGHSREWETPEPNGDTLLRLLREFEAAGQNPWAWLGANEITDENELAQVKNKRRQELCSALDFKLAQLRKAQPKLFNGGGDVSREGMAALRK